MCEGDFAAVESGQRRRGRTRKTGGGIKKNVVSVTNANEFVFFFKKFVIKLLNAAEIQFDLRLPFPSCMS